MHPRPGSGETAGFPSVAEPGEFGVDKDDDLVNAVPPLVIAVSTNDAEAADEEKMEDADCAKDAAADKQRSHSFRSGSEEVGAMVQSTEVPLEMATPATAQPISQDGMSRVALEASFFLYERATTLSAQGWYNKARSHF